MNRLSFEFKLEPKKKKNLYLMVRKQKRGAVGSIRTCF